MPCSLFRLTLEVIKWENPSIKNVVDIQLLTLSLVCCMKQMGKVGVNDTWSKPVLACGEKKRSGKLNVLNVSTRCQDFRRPRVRQETH